jgi:hypothetical protein
MEPFTAISCDGTTNVTVEGNFIHDNYFSTYRIWVGKGNELPDVSTILINDNCIAGNPRWLINIVSSQLDATGNWGAHDGPSPPGSGDSVEGNVNVADFLTNEPKECKRECITIWLLQARAGLCQQEQDGAPPRRVPPRSHQGKRFTSRSRQEIQVLKMCPSVGLAFHHSLG